MNRKRKQTTPRLEDTHQVSVVLKAMQQRYKLAGKIERAEMPQIWQEVVGERIAGVSRVTDFHRGILHVQVRSGAWRTELTMLHDSIVAKLNKRLTDLVDQPPHVKKIVFR